MRIGLITGEYPPMQGGVGDFSSQLGQAWADLDHEVHVITGRIEDAILASGGASPRPGIVVHRVVEGWGWGCWKRVLATARDVGAEVLNVQYQAAAYRMRPAIHFLPRRERRPPVVVTFHDLKVPYLFPKAGPLRWWIVRMLARRADRVILTNREDYARLVREVSRKRLSLIPIGSNIRPVPPPAYDRDAERARWSVGREDLLLGYFGFLNESKGGEELIQTLALLVERGISAHLLMIGGRVGSSDPTNQAYAARVDRLISELGMEERVHWTGYLGEDGVSAGLMATDVCVLPYRDGVSFRRGTLHACLAHRRAIVTTRPAVPLPEARHGETMLLVEPRNPDALAEKVARLAGDPALRSRLEEGAGSLAAEFGWERIARQTAALFRRLAGSGS